MSTHPRYKRRNYFVNKEFQGRTIFNYFILATLGSILFMAVFSFFSSNTLSITYDNYHLQLGVTPGILFQKILSTQWVFIVLGGVVVVFVTLILTHRVAGPFFRFEKTLDAMVDKDLSDTIVLRKKDEGKNLAEKINTFTRILQNDLGHIDARNENIAACAKNLEKILHTPDPDMVKARANLDEILHSQKNISQTVRAYNFSAAKE
jgi:methyl-accepting chemotaxis protein